MNFLALGSRAYAWNHHWKGWEGVLKYVYEGELKRQMLLLDTSTEAQALRARGVNLEAAAAMLRARSEDRVVDLLQDVRVTNTSIEFVPCPLFLIFLPFFYGLVFLQSEYCIVFLNFYTFRRLSNLLLSFRTWCFSQVGMLSISDEVEHLRKRVGQDLVMQQYYQQQSWEERTMHRRSQPPKLYRYRSTRIRSQRPPCALPSDGLAKGGPFLRHIQRQYYIWWSSSRCPRPIPHLILGTYTHFAMSLIIIFIT